MDDISPYTDECIEMCMFIQMWMVTHWHGTSIWNIEYGIYMYLFGAWHIDIPPSHLKHPEKWGGLNKCYFSSPINYDLHISHISTLQPLLPKLPKTCNLGFLLSKSCWTLQMKSRLRSSILPISSKTKTCRAEKKTSCGVIGSEHGQMVW